MTDHSSSGGFVFDSHLLDNPPKPGSRRARRMAERLHASQSADTAEIPPVNAATSAPCAEQMSLVTSRAKKVPAPRQHRYTRMMRVAGVASLTVFAAGGTSGVPGVEVPRVEQAVAAVVNQASSAPVTAAADVAFDVMVDGTTTRVNASSGITYAVALAQAGIEIGARDEVSVSLADAVSAEPVTIVRVSTKTVFEDYKIPFETTRVETNELAEGEEKVQTPGTAGAGKRNFQVTYRDGVESARMLLVETVSAEPVAEVVRVGVRPAASAVPPSAPVPPGSARQTAQGMLANYGWGADQWPCLDALWQRESGWNAAAANRSSGAYGIPQALPGSKMASAGADWKTNPATQIAWGLGYISGRYGSPCGAWNHSQSRGWY